MTRVALVLLTSLLAADVAHAQSANARWPERPIRFIVPSTAGSSSDIVGRLVAQKLAERLGQPLVVENRVGGGGSIGSGEVARADADGYTLGLANTSTHAVAASVAPLSYDPVSDFAPVSMLGHSPFVLALHPGVPAQSVQELIALARAKPRKLNYAPPAPRRSRTSPARCSRRWRRSSSPTCLIAAPRSRRSICSKVASKCSSAPSRRHSRIFARASCAHWQ
jgi:tripartite-type tricarboxylate transporter receptor subunit TctC